MRRLLFAVFFLLPAVARADFTFSQLAVGGGYECVLIVSNMANVDISVSAFAFPDDPQSGATWKIDGHSLSGGYGLGMRAKETQKFVLSGGDSTSSGFLVLETLGTHDDSLAISFFYIFRNADRIITSTGSAPSSQGMRIGFPVEKSPAINTGLAWSCMNANTFAPYKPTLNFTLHDSQGQIVATKRISPADSHKALFFDQLFAGTVLPDNFVGNVLIEVSGYWPICVTVLRIDNNADGSFLLTSVPPNFNVP